MKKTDYAYLAGIFDGEGQASIRKRSSGEAGFHFYPKVSVGMTNDYVPKLLYFSFGGKLHPCKRPEGKNWKPCLRWEATGSDAIEFLKIIYPYLVIKKPQADILLKFQMLKGHRRAYTPMDRALEETEFLRVKDLNLKGIRN